MKAQLMELISYFRSSYWFIPLVMAVLACLLAFGTTSIDLWLGENWVHESGWLFVNQPEGARAILATIAGSIITVAGVTFSITILTVSFAMGQIGPSLIHNFMRDKANQITIGMFIATFLYCLLVLRTVVSAGESDELASFVPHIAIFVAILLMLASTALLIFFIHHIPESINVSNILANIAKEMRIQITKLFPDEIGVEAQNHLGQAVPDDQFQEKHYLVNGSNDGYIRYIDGDLLLQIAIDNDCIIKIECQPGTFVTQATPLISVTKQLDDRVNKDIIGAFIIGNKRDQQQDILFLAEQISEIIARALSPGVNSPFIAMMALDWLGAIIPLLAQRKMPDGFRYDSNKELRIVAYPILLPQFVNTVLDQVQPYVCVDANAAHHIMRMMIKIISSTKNRTLKQVIELQAEKYYAAANNNLKTTDAKEKMQIYLMQIKHKLADSSHD